ncbi:hypothetical protein HDU86_003387, partial [Geranomyces michiganensis]
GTLTIENIEDPELNITITDVLYVPDAQRNLVSTAPLIKAGYEVHIGPTSSILKGGIPVLHLRHDGNLPFIEGVVETPASAYVTET